MNKRFTPERIISLAENEIFVFGSNLAGSHGGVDFCNPPSHIAQLFHEVFEEPEFKNKFRLISFAILDDHNAHRSHNPEGNYKPFVEEFC